MELNKLRANIEKAIDASGKTREAIAQELGMSYNQLWRLLSGRRKLQAETVAKIAMITGKTPNDLFGELGNPTQAPVKAGAENAAAEPVVAEG